MPDTTFGELAQLVRSKNAGPYWMTIDVFFADDTGYERAARALTGEAVAGVYHLDPARVRLYRLPAIRVIKASFPRPVVQGGFGERDMHSGQQHVPLAALPVPEKQEH
jgi:Domain of unknown function (DUF4387)